MKTKEITFGKALLILEACESAYEDYAHMTLTEAWNLKVTYRNASDHEDALYWFIREVSDYIPPKRKQAIDNAYHYGLINDTKKYIDRDLCFTPEKCINAMRKSIGLRTLRTALNKKLATFCKTWDITPVYVVKS